MIQPENVFPADRGVPTVAIPNEDLSALSPPVILPPVPPAPDIPAGTGEGILPEPPPGGIPGGVEFPFGSEGPDE